MIIMTFIFNIIFQIRENTKYVIWKRTYDNCDFWDGALLDIAGRFSTVGVTGGFFLSVAGVLDQHPNFIIYLIVWLLCYIIVWFYLRVVDNTRVYILICKYVQTGVICRVEEGPKCNDMPTINFFLIFAVEWICKWS